MTRREGAWAAENLASKCVLSVLCDHLCSYRRQTVIGILACKAVCVTRIPTGSSGQNVHYALSARIAQDSYMQTLPCRIASVFQAMSLIQHCLSNAESVWSTHTRPWEATETAQVVLQGLSQTAELHRLTASVQWGRSSSTRHLRSLCARRVGKADSRTPVQTSMLIYNV